MGVLLVLSLIGAVLAAWMVARRRRHFAHVEEATDWPPHGEGAAVEPVIVAPKPPVPGLPEFRKRCAEALQEAGWTTQFGFPGAGDAPDILARRDTLVAAVRCRPSNTAITGEMVDEAAVMGTRLGAGLTLLTSNAPFSSRARDEAVRQGVRLLRDSELAGFVG